ncbi:MAG: TldD/PmbA family protein [Bacillota bacterium]
MLSKNIIEDVISASLSTGGDFAEIFVEDKENNSINMISGKIEKANKGRDYGVGIRILDDTNAVYAYTNDDSKTNLIKVAKKAAAALEGKSKNLKLDFNKKEYENKHIIKIYPGEKTQKDKVEIMKEANSYAKNYHDLISQVVVNYLDQNQNVLIANSDGLYVEDQRVHSRIMISAVATKDGEKQTGFYGPGAHKGFEFFENMDIKNYAREAARTAVTMVEADYAPSGKMPVIIDNEFGGVIFHEACGHGLEATSVAKNTSVFANKLGEKVASELITAIDDGTIKNGWGSANIDDEGHPTQKNVLIEDGILKGYMIDKLNGRRMDMEATGSSRRQSYKFAPTSRMTNTFIANGNSTKDEIISNTEYGLFAKYLGGGSVNPATGEFNFNVREGYMVRDGKIAEPVRGATLIGKGDQILKKIDMLGNNLALAEGMCGSISGSIPAGLGQPILRVSELTVGGRKENE